MHLLLISANRELFPDPVFPLGAAYVAESARRAGHDIRVVDLLGQSRPRDLLLREIQAHFPDVIAISLRNLDNAAYPLTKNYLPSYKTLVQDLRAMISPRKVPVVVGGSAFSLMPDLLLDELDADFGIAGEGEESFPLLLDALEKNKPVACIPGVTYRPSAGSPPVVVPPSPSMDFPYALSGRVQPAHDLFALRRYVRTGGMANIQTKRGCAFRCKYCTYPLLEGSSFRLRPPGDVADEVEELVRKFDVRSFFIVDSIFNTPPDHAEEVCEALIRKNLRIRWSCYATPAGMTMSLLRTMKRAGCDGIELGTDSGENGVLAGLGKSFSVSHMKAVGEWCQTLGLSLCHTLIFGGPGETPESVRETCRVVEETRPTAVVAMAGIRIYPDTPLAKMAESMNIVTHRKQYLEPVFYLEPALEPVLTDMLLSFSEPRGNWILPGLVVPLKPMTQRIIRLAGYRRPLWHLLRYAPFKDRIYRDR